MSHPPTQKRNPHKLTIKQHVHSAHAIGKFCGDNGNVHVHIFGKGKKIWVKETADIFCTKRSWDQKTETILMAEIEKKFHKEIGTLKVFELRNHSAISEYFFLWRIRHHFHISPQGDGVLNGIYGDKLTKDQEEILEKRGISYVDSNSTVPSRFCTGTNIKIWLDHCFQNPRIKGLEWGLIKGLDGEFIVADCYKDSYLFPISPTRAFIADCKDMSIDRNDVAKFNKISISESTNFYFAKDLSLCPTP